MPTDKDLLTVGKIAAGLKAPPAKVKKAIADLKLEPVAKRGACTYYATADIAKIKKVLG